MQTDLQLELELPLGRQRPPRRPPRRNLPTQAWREAAEMAHLGRSVILRLDGARERAERVGDILYLPLPHEADEAQIRDRAQGWLQGEAKRLFGERLAQCAQRLDMPTPAWQLAFTSGMTAELAADGRLRLSWRLVQLAPEDIDRRLLALLEPLRSRAGARGLWDAASLPA